MLLMVIGVKASARSFIGCVNSSHGTWVIRFFFARIFLGNEPQQKILTANDWQLVDVFRNRRTDNEVGIHVKHLADLGVAIGSKEEDYQKEP